MGCNYSEEDWEELKKIIFVKYSLSDDKTLDNFHLDLSSLIGNSIIHGVNSLVRYMETMYYLHHDSMVDSIARNIVRYLTCDFNEVALGVNTECVKNIIAWRLEHGK